MTNTFSFRLPRLFALMTVLAFALPLVAQEAGHLRIRVKPPVAGVFLDGMYLGPGTEFEGNRSIDLEPGKHEVKFVDPRHKEMVVTVNAEAGKTQTLRRTLEKLPAPAGPFGLLKIHNAGRSIVYVNGKYHGQAEEFDGPGEGLQLPPGEYELQIDPRGMGSAHKEKVKLEANETTLVTVP